MRGYKIGMMVFLIASLSLSSSLSAAGGAGPTHNPTLRKAFLRYENILKTKKDTAGLRELSASAADASKASSKLRDAILENEIASSAIGKLSDDVAAGVKNPNQRKQALGTLIGSMKKSSGEDRLFVTTALSDTELKEAFGFFDKVGISFVSSDPSGKNAYELTFAANGSFARLLKAKLGAGEVPLTILDGVDTLKPTVVQGLVSTGTYLNGEVVSSLWGMNSIGAVNYQYGLSKGTKVRVGIIDTGISNTHADLKANLGTGTDAGYNFIAANTNAVDDNGHGSHVSGIVGGSVNGAGVFGVDSNVTLIPLKVLDASGNGSSYTIVDAINYAANNGIKVINMSLGGTGNPTGNIICNAITSAKLKGTTSVVAAGNSNVDVSTTVPAGCTDAITVGAVDSTKTKASFSNYGSKVDVSAPGVSIYSSYLGTSYASLNGTSMASPFVAGLVASILSYSPALTPDQIKAILKDPNNSSAVNSSVAMGRYVSMDKVMTSLGVQNDSLLDTTPPNTGSGGTGSLPVLSLSSVLSGTNSYTVNASAYESGGTIVWYGFWNGSTLLSSGSAQSVSLTISADTTINVTVTDANGISASKSILLKYTAPIVNQAPTLSVTFKSLNTKTNRVTINTSDPDGIVTKVDIYLNGVYKYYATPNTQTYSGYIDLAKGKSNTVKVIVTDDKGATTTQSITVK